MTRPLYRWKSFWLGVLVLVFLGWAWRDSFTAYTSGCGTHFSIGQCAGGLNLTYHPKGIRFIFFRSPAAFRLNVKNGRFGGFSLLRAGDPLTPAWPPLLGGHNTSFVPHWLIIVLFFLPWTAFLAWRWRRMRRRSRLGYV